MQVFHAAGSPPGSSGARGPGRATARLGEVWGEVSTGSSRGGCTWQEQEEEQEEQEERLLNLKR